MKDAAPFACLERLFSEPLKKQSSARHNRDGSSPAVCTMTFRRSIGATTDFDATPAHAPLSSVFHTACVSASCASRMCQSSCRPPAGNKRHRHEALPLHRIAATRLSPNRCLGRSSSPTTTKRRARGCGEVSKLQFVPSQGNSGIGTHRRRLKYVDCVGEREAASWACRSCQALMTIRCVFSRCFVFYLP